MSTSGDDPISIDDIILPSTPKMPITRERWNNAWLFIHERLLAREELEASFELLIEQGIQAALDYIQVTVAPRLEELQVDIDAAIAAIKDLIEEGTAPNSAKLGNQLPSYYATADHEHSAEDINGLEDFVETKFADLVGAAPAALDTLEELANALGEDPNFATTVTSAIAGKISRAGDTMTGPLSLISSDIWSIRVGVGELYIVDTSIAGVDIPPSGTTGPVFVQLTAGLRGSGQYNNGKFASETVSGSAPDVLATAVISLTGSPINGKTIRLLNTEGRIIRPYTTSGTILGDAIRNITGTLSDTGEARAPLSTTGGDPVTTGAFGYVTNGSGKILIGGQTYTKASLTFDASKVVPTANEIRMKMLGVTAYMRIK